MNSTNRNKTNYCTKEQNDIFKRRLKKCTDTYKMLNITSCQGNANQQYNEILSYPAEVNISKKKIIKTITEMQRKRNAYILLVAMEISTSNMETILEKGCSKMRNITIIWLNITSNKNITTSDFTTSYISKENEVSLSKRHLSSLFIAAQFIVGRISNKLKCSLEDKCIRKYAMYSQQNSMEQMKS